MAKLKILSFALAAPADKKEEAADYLQRAGVVELSEPQETDRLKLSDLTDRFAGYDQALSVVNAAQAVLAQYCPRKKPLTAMLEPRKELSPEEWALRGRQLDGTLAE